MKNPILKIIDLQGNMPKRFYDGIRRKPDNSFYFDLEFNTAVDPDPSKFIFSPQINNITMEMPKVPLYTNWNSIDKVFKKFYKTLMFIRNFSLF